MKASWGWMLALAVWVVASRWAYLSDAPLMSKDGPLYIESLKLDRSYCVPMPGNIGYVVLGRLAGRVWDDPTRAFGAVNAGLTIVGAWGVFALARRRVSTPLAGLAAMAIATNPVVWWHGETINSYLVWLAVPPMIGLFGLRFIERGRRSDLVLCSVALGIGTALRQDLIAFGTPLWAGCLLWGRASRRDWALGLAIVAGFVAAWFGGTAAVLGGPWEYLARVRAKHAGHMEGFSPEHRGLVEGLLRNGAKYSLFLIWAAAPALVPAAGWLVGRLADPRRSVRALGLGLLWVGPSWAFALLVFAGNAGMVFVLLPPLYLAAARGLDAGPGGRRGLATAAMGALVLAGAWQFAGAPLLPETNQRNVILNVTFLRYSGPGLRARLDGNLDDYGIDPSLRAVLRQLREPSPSRGRLAALASGGSRR